MPNTYFKFDPNQIDQSFLEFQSFLASGHEVEVSFTEMPAPFLFKNIVDQFEQNFKSSENWHFSKKEAVFTGTLFGINFSKPERAVIEIANGCNLKCDFCWTHSPINTNPPDKQWLKQTLDTKVILKYIDDLKKFNTVRLIEICAIGDPMYHPDIWDILKYIKSNGFNLRLSTNATLLFPNKLDQYLDGLAIDELFMNISAGDRDTYANIHNVSPKIYDQLIENLYYLNIKNKKNSVTSFKRHINIMTSKNINNIEEIVSEAVATEMNFIDFRFVWEHKDFQKNIGITDSEAKNLIEKKSFYTKLIKEKNISSNILEFISYYERQYGIS